jgi:hypothetical protein
MDDLDRRRREEEDLAGAPKIDAREFSDALAKIHGHDWAQTRHGVWVAARETSEAVKAGGRLSSIMPKVLPRNFDVFPQTDLLPSVGKVSAGVKKAIMAVIYAADLTQTSLDQILTFASRLDRDGGELGHTLPRIVATPLRSVTGVPRIILTSGAGGRRGSVDAIMEGFDFSGGTTSARDEVGAVNRFRAACLDALDARRLKVASSTEHAHEERPLSGVIKASRNAPADGAGGGSGEKVAPGAAIFKKRKTL